MLDNLVSKLMNEEYVYQIVKKDQYKMNFSIVSFLFICFGICLTISAKTDRLSRRYGDSIQSSMPTYPLSYSVIQGVFDKDGKDVRYLLEILFFVILILIHTYTFNRIFNLQQMKEKLSEHQSHIY